MLENADNVSAINGSLPGTLYITRAISPCCHMTQINGKGKIQNIKTRVMNREFNTYQEKNKIYRKRSL